MNLKQQIIKKILPLVATAWGIVYFIVMIIQTNEAMRSVNNYLFVITCFFVTIYTMVQAIKTNDNGILLYGSLGFCCLTLGNIYFILLHLVSSVPDYISIGYFSDICCYLFFLSALIRLKEYVSQNHKLINNVVVFLSVIAAIICLYAVISNNDLVMTVAVTLLDTFCATVAVSLLPNRNARFLAIMMLTICLCDILVTLNFSSIIALLVQAFVSLLYLLFGQSFISLKVGD